MKKILKFALPLLLLAGVVSANAAEMKIAVVDVNQVIQQSSKMKTVADQMSKEFKPRQEKIVKLQKQLKTDLEKLQRDETVMSNTEKKKLQDKIVSTKRELQRTEEDFQQDLNREQGREMEKFTANFKVAVDKIAKNGHYNLILQKNSVPYADANIDITDQVIKALS